jgi:biopolymer transport protein TolR
MRLRKTDLIEAEISLIPLIDVSLVLIIILLVVVPMVRTSTAAVSKKVPAKPVPASVLAIDEPQLAISLEADGALYVDGRRVARNELQSVLGEIRALTPDRPVVVKGDRRLRYEQVRWVLQSVSAAGFRRAGLTADARPSR